LTATISIAIPTYRRGEILIRTIESLLQLTRRADEILIIDQTEQHPPSVEQRLSQFAGDADVRMIRLPQPSIPRAMNTALLHSANELVLFLDDDVSPSPTLVEAHLDAHARRQVAAVVGQVLQPGQKSEPIVQSRDPLAFRFNANEPAAVQNVMAGNLSVRRDIALSIGGFDEHFVGAAYRFETDFAFRLVAAGHGIWYEPAAWLRHLKLESGGLRALGEHRTSPRPDHSVGDYYFAIRHLGSPAAYALKRLRQNVLTRYHLRRPWTIPAKLVGEVRGMLLARRLARTAPALLPLDRR
jgi:GT2 family glycosyltransferase